MYWMEVSAFLMYIIQLMRATFRECAKLMPWMVESWCRNRLKPI